MWTSQLTACLLPLIPDSSAIKTQTKTKTQALASPTIGDSLHPSLIPIPSPLLPSQTNTLAISVRPLEARTLSSTTIKRVTCILQVWGFSWEHLSRSQIQQAKAMEQPQETCTVSIPTYSTRNRFRTPAVSHRNNHTRLALSYITTRPMTRWITVIMLCILKDQALIKSYRGSPPLGDFQQDIRTTCKRTPRQQWKGD